MTRALPRPTVHAHPGERLARALRVARVLKRRALAVPRGGTRAALGLLAVAWAVGGFHVFNAPADLAATADLATLGAALTVLGVRKMPDVRW